jgi:3-keto-5-aminohexanoate cleavage enzyme
VITAAIVGAETMRAQNPHVPYTADELAAEAERCAKAGAAVIHLHVRDDEGRASQEGARFRQAIRAIRARTDVVIQTSTGGAVGMSVAERAGPLECTGADAPEMASLNVGTINFGDDVFMNKAGDTVDMARRIAAHGAVPEIEIYDAGHLDIAAELLTKGLVTPPLHLQFVLGVRGALSASERNLELLIERMQALLPDGCSWGVAGIGRHQLPMAALAAMWGGNARVGLEDNIYLDKGVLAEGSAPLVARAVELCERHGRAVATAAQARELLGLRTPV